MENRKINILPQTDIHHHSSDEIESTRYFTTFNFCFKKLESRFSCLRRQWKAFGKQSFSLSGKRDRFSSRTFLCLLTFDKPKHSQLVHTQALPTQRAFSTARARIVSLKVSLKGSKKLSIFHEKNVDFSFFNHHAILSVNWKWKILDNLIFALWKVNKSNWSVEIIWYQKWKWRSLIVNY